MKRRSAIGLAFAAILLLLTFRPGGAVPPPTEEGKLVDMLSDDAYAIPYNDTTAICLVGHVVLFHNGAAIACDSAVQYNDKQIEFFRNVTINQDSTYIYGDRAEYDGLSNVARVYAPLVKVVDGATTLYTYHFAFNTLDKIGEFSGGGIVFDTVNRLESERGYYFVDRREIVCVDRVELRNDDYELQSDSLVYEVADEQARFYTGTRIWSTKGDFLRTERGAYLRAEECYRFFERGYVLTTDYEVWADSIDYWRLSGDALLRRDIQVDDRTHKVLAFGDWGRYWGESERALLTRRPSAISYDSEQGDSLFVRADTMLLVTLDPARIAADSMARHAADSLARARAADSLARFTPATETDRQPGGEPSAVAASEPGTGGEPLATASGATVTAASPDTDSSPNAASLRDAADFAGTPAATVGSQIPAGARSPGEPSPGLDTMTGTLPDSLTRSLPDSLAGALPAGSADSLRRTAADSVALADSLSSPEALRAARKAAEQEARLMEKRKRDEARIALARERRERIREKLRAEQAQMEALQRKAEERQAIKQRERIAKYRAKHPGRPLEGRLWEDSLALIAADSMAGVRDSLARMRADSLPADTLGPSGVESPVAADSIATSRTDSLGLAGLDSLTADTIQRIVYAWRNVRGWRSDFQMVADSLVAFSRDSTMHLYVDPVLWSEQSQITSDVMDIFTERQQLVRAEFVGEPVMAQQVDTGRFNQIAGKTMTARFRDNEIYRNDVNGNVEGYYYLRDDETGVLQAFLKIECGDMTFFILDRTIDRIIARVDPEWTVYPIEQIPESQPQRLQQFRWEGERRPDRAAVFDRTIRPSLREESESLPRPLFPLTAKINGYIRMLVESGTWVDRTDPLPPTAVEFIRSLGY